MRSNLQSLGASEQERNLRNRYVQQLDAEETRLQEILRKAADMQRQLQEKQKALDEFLTSLALDKEI